MATIAVNGVRLNVRRLPPRNPRGGVPPTVVFVHGAFIDSLASFYFTLGPAFAATGFDAVLYDQRGHGRSGRPATGYTVQDFSADLAGLLDALGIGHPVHLVGNSFGGTVALDFAWRWPDRAASVVVIESGPATPQWAATMRAALHQATRELPEGEALSWFVRQYGALSSARRIAPDDPHIMRLGRGAARLIASTTIAGDIPASAVLSREEIAALRCPVLLLNGGQGLVAAQTAELASLLPRVRVAEVPGQRHSVLVEAPREVCRIALGWVGEQAWPSPAPGTVPGAAAR
ncbi:alpha/beta fold hydrolase [Streptomyces sp. 7-21]|uniref:alpha/beta fold hydrolase n=1 Tax=Streptomyces sp. 7-21 TaxID=2802283 RepID=UPI00191D55C9|nr:alpha/beta hydrolase [Streptomyces sp. 7-21]MBL1068750.1 alpha/beta hydrolase [Streptomyces sp. 7-21]